MTRFWRDVAELAALRRRIPPERRAMSGVRDLLVDTGWCMVLGCDRPARPGGAHCERCWREDIP